MKGIMLAVIMCVLVLAMAGCTRQYHMRAWDRSRHHKLGEWYVYSDLLGNLRTVDNDAVVALMNATVVLEEVEPPKNRVILVKP